MKAGERGGVLKFLVEVNAATKGGGGWFSGEGGLEMGDK